MGNTILPLCYGILKTEIKTVFVVILAKIFENVDVLYTSTRNINMLFGCPNHCHKFMFKTEPKLIVVIDSTNVYTVKTVRNDMHLGIVRIKLKAVTNNTNTQKALPIVKVDSISGILD